MRQRVRAHDANAEHWGLGLFPSSAFQMVGPCRPPMRPLWAWPTARALVAKQMRATRACCDLASIAALRDNLACRLCNLPLVLAPRRPGCLVTCFDRKPDRASRPTPARDQDAKRVGRPSPKQSDRLPARRIGQPREALWWKGGVKLFTEPHCPSNPILSLPACSPRVEQALWSGDARGKRPTNTIAIRAERAVEDVAKNEAAVRRYRHPERDVELHRAGR
ncbi:hypothetical protein B0T14DRAFT_137871 [Immersiella caudata]|uniref:Uncharacterized protein n=1 Tax=Immersiella caudata TaxID=314043 RepID=A0AA39X557_9PEZI|nr:hypothetical protein B0T14DRAFT_137871 [Immersiella caudata]